MTELDIRRREGISALADGQLSGPELDRVLDAFRVDEDALATWHCYHVLGDVLRGGEVLDASRDAAFLVRLRENLREGASIPAGADAGLQTIVVGAGAIESSPGRVQRPSANDTSFQWRWVAGLAVMALAVSAVWWSVPGTLQTTAAPVMAQSPASVPSGGLTIVSRSTAMTAVGPHGMIRDPKLDQWLAAHRQFGGASALQGPAGFVRNATFEGGAR